MSHENSKSFFCHDIYKAATTARAAPRTPATEPALATAPPVGTDPEPDPVPEPEPEPEPDPDPDPDPVMLAVGEIGVPVTAAVPFIAMVVAITDPAELVMVATVTDEKP